MSEGDLKYALLRKKVEGKKVAASNLSGFYKTVVSPAAVPGLLLIFIGLLWKSLGFPDSQEGGNQLETLVFVVLLLANFLIGIRLVQACFLAMRDYGEHVSLGGKHVLIFVVLLMLSSGLVPYFSLHLAPSILMAVRWITILYAFFSFLGFLHYLNVYRKMLSPNAKTIDYTIERKIQCTNFLIQLCYVLLFLSGFIFSFSSSDAFNVYGIIAVLGLVSILTFINMGSSWTWSTIPCYTLTNSPVSYGNICNGLKREYAHASWISDESWSGVEEVIAKCGEAEVIIETVRASRDDVDEITEHFCREFGYVFQHILGSDVPTKIVEGFVRLLVAGGGRFSHLNFYFIMNKESERVGFFSCSCSKVVPWSRRFIEIPKIVFFLLKRVGFSGLRGVIGRIREIASSKVGNLPETDLAIDYLVIYEEFRRKGYAKGLVRLLRAAFLENSTYCTNFDCIKAIVREENQTAVTLFSSQGFKEKVIAPLDDPFRNLDWKDKKIGTAKLMVMSILDVEDAAK